MCWTGENLLAISGIGSDEEAMLAGVRIFDVTTGSQVAAFAGPPRSSPAPRQFGCRSLAGQREQQMGRISRAMRAVHITAWAVPDRWLSAGWFRRD
jgi:hypothetical protein